MKIEIYTTIPESESGEKLKNRFQTMSEWSARLPTLLHSTILSIRPLVPLSCNVKRVEFLFLGVTQDPLLRIFVEPTQTGGRLLQASFDKFIIKGGSGLILDVYVELLVPYLTLEKRDPLPPISEDSGSGQGPYTKNLYKSFFGPLSIALCKALQPILQSSLEPSLTNDCEPEGYNLDSAVTSTTNSSSTPTQTKPKKSRVSRGKRRRTRQPKRRSVSR